MVKFVALIAAFSLVVWVGVGGCLRMFVVCWLIVLNTWVGIVFYYVCIGLIALVGFVAIVLLFLSEFAWFVLGNVVFGASALAGGLVWMFVLLLVC